MLVVVLVDIIVSLDAFIIESPSSSSTEVPSSKHPNKLTFFQRLNLRSSCIDRVRDLSSPSQGAITDVVVDDGTDDDDDDDVVVVVVVVVRRYQSPLRTQFLVFGYSEANFDVASQSFKNLSRSINASRAETTLSLGWSMMKI